MRSLTAPKLKLQACAVEATSDDEEEEEKRMMGILLRIKQAKMVLEESRMRKSSQMVRQSLPFFTHTNYLHKFI